MLATLAAVLLVGQVPPVYDLESATPRRILVYHGGRVLEVETVPVVGASTPPVVPVPDPAPVPDPTGFRGVGRSAAGKLDPALRLKLAGLYRSHAAESGRFGDGTSYVKALAERLEAGLDDAESSAAQPVFAAFREAFGKAWGAGATTPARIAEVLAAFAEGVGP